MTLATLVPSLTLPLVFCLVAVLRALKQSGPGEKEERERGGKSHEKKSVLSYYNDYREYGYDIYAIYCFRIRFVLTVLF